MKNTFNGRGKTGLLVLLCFCSIHSSAQYSDIEWSAYFYEKNVKMADTELVENIVASLEGSKEYIYIVGQTLSTSPSNTFCSAPLGNGDAFLAKYDANG